LPTDHLSAESKDVMKAAMGLVATMAALVLGLLTASAKSSFRHAGRRDQAGRLSPHGSKTPRRPRRSRFEGLIQVSSVPLRYAIAHIGG
jgi:hypothetical protein